MITANKQMEVFTKIKKERKGVRGKPTVSLYSEDLRFPPTLL
jgi:hypothetical protein